MRTLHCRACIVLFLWLGAGVASAAVYQADPSNYETFVTNLQPGDTLELQAGTYPNALWVTGMHGTAEAPITIRGPESGEAAVFEAESCCNTIQFDNASHIVIEHLTLDGLHRPEPAAISARDVTHDITIANVRIVDYDGDRNTVGISTKGPAWNWVVRDNVIVDTGTGMYFGNSDGSYPFVNGLIERNLVYNTLGYNIQIKHQNPRPSGIGMPTGDNTTIIRHNVFSKGDNSEGGSGARPNLLVGHWPLSGTGQDDMYLIHDNFFYQNPTESLFQGEGNVAFYDNLLVNDFGNAIRVQPHNDVPKRIEIFHNTVVASGDGISISGASADYEQRIEANAVFAGDPLSGPGQAYNITGARSAAADHLNAPDAALGDLDLYPQVGALDGDAVPESVYSGFDQSGRDFDGEARTGVFRGAYAGEGTHEGWPLALAIKDSATTDSGGGSGGSSGDGTGGDSGSGSDGSSGDTTGDDSASGTSTNDSDDAGGTGSAGLPLIGMLFLIAALGSRRRA